MSGGFYEDGTSGVKLVNGENGKEPPFSHCIIVRRLAAGWGRFQAKDREIPRSLSQISGDPPSPSTIYGRCRPRLAKTVINPHISPMTEPATVPIVAYILQAATFSDQVE